ncbi:MAG: SurA N-terminal domain-containing protein, partial [Prevotellaceae bacterium]|nr:SurA N-terminal domain-containing protein [Prevotellaceae bacterium]
MALLQKIRTNLVAQLAIGLGMVAFIVTGFVTCSRGPREQETTVAKLNGEELDRQSFDSQVEEFKNILRIVQQKPLDYNFTSEEDAQIREQVYQRFVQKNLLEKECSALGLTVTDNELANIIKEGTHPLLTHLPLFLTQNRTFDY